MYERELTFLSSPGVVLSSSVAALVKLIVTSISPDNADGAFVSYTYFIVDGWAEKYTASVPFETVTVLPPEVLASMLEILSPKSDADESELKKNL